MAEKKIKVLIGNKTISLSAAAYKIAKRFYGAVSEAELQLAKPIELQKPLIRPTVKPVIIKPPLKEVPEVKVPEGDPMSVEEVVADVTGDPVGTVIEEAKVTVDVAGDPVTERPAPKKRAAKTKRK